jgi:hypothetical protein
MKLSVYSGFLLTALASWLLSKIISAKSSNAKAAFLLRFSGFQSAVLPHVLSLAKNIELYFQLLQIWLFKRLY